MAQVLITRPKLHFHLPNQAQLALIHTLLIRPLVVRSDLDLEAQVSVAQDLVAQGLEAQDTGAAIEAAEEGAIAERVLTNELHQLMVHTSTQIMKMRPEKALPIGTKKIRAHTTDRAIVGQVATVDEAAGADHDTTEAPLPHFQAVQPSISPASCSH